MNSTPSSPALTEIGQRTYTYADYLQEERDRALNRKVMYFQLFAALLAGAFYVTAMLNRD